MNNLALLVSNLVARLWAPSEFSQWSPPGHSDVRGPCPMLNALANHRLLPHDGKNIDLNATVHALGAGLNAEPTLSGALFAQAMLTNPAPGATSFSLDQLTRHNIIEHDGSLSRQDAVYGRADVFNATIFAETQAHWHGPVIDVQMAANARAARIQSSNKTNPTFEWNEQLNSFSLAETVAYLVVLGDRESITVPRNRVEYLLKNERLPLELGWRRPKAAITLADMNKATKALIDATPAAAGDAAVDGQSKDGKGVPDKVDEL